MLDPAAYAVFLGAALALLVVPGPAVLYIVARSVHQGRRAGLASVLGIHVGTLVHVLAATVGLSALVASSATAFTVVKLLGAAYLVYLGVRTLAGRGESVGPRLTARRGAAGATSRRASSSTS
jgi:threonine/homoserine/homoserine lactone efflux protein